MKFKYVLFVCYLVSISYAFAANNALNAEQPTAELVGISDEEIAEAEAASSEQIISDSNVSITEPVIVKPRAKKVKKKENHNQTEPIVTKLKDILANITEVSNITTDEEVETTTQYDVKHYLTAEQKYYMLRINLLGIGIRVVHDIIPIPVVNTDQYKKSMEALLDKVQAAREASVNITAGKMHNITLEDAHKLQMKMVHTGETESAAASKTSPVSRTTEAMILVGVVVAIVIIAGLLYACKRAMDGKGDYYDHLQGGGGSVPLN